MKYSIATTPFVALILIACGGAIIPPISPPDLNQFSAPMKMSMNGYVGHIQEPFLSRDGAFLFFNSEGPDKDLYWATVVNATTFQFQGVLAEVNTTGVEGTPTLDNDNHFYFITTGFYAPPMWDTIYTADWNGTSLQNSQPVSGLAVKQPFQINFDVEVSADGQHLYFNDGDFTSLNNFPDQGNIAIAEKDAQGNFSRVSNSAQIMANINTSNLEYAPAISNNELEFFFTRLDLTNLTTAIYIATRTNKDGVFNIPLKIDAIEGFVEGPTISSDGKSLYYHRANPSTGIFELYRVTKP